MSCIEISCLGFNTTFVTVLLYSGIYGASDCSVSIQLLLLFYYATFNDYEWDNGFQYNFCYCSMISRARPVYIMYRFQYNFCYCSIYYEVLCKLSEYMFQYNFCYCSIRIPPMPACLHGSFQYNFCYCSIRIFTGFLFYYITRYPLKIKIF